MLIRLPNDQWVNPQAVEAVTVLADDNTVRVSLEPDRWFDIEAGLDAARLRDQIAECINIACHRGGRS
jgi:hypothetical protein